MQTFRSEIFPKNTQQPCRGTITVTCVKTKTQLHASQSAQQLNCTKSIVSLRMSPHHRVSQDVGWEQFDHSNHTSSSAACCYGETSLPGRKWQEDPSDVWVFVVKSAHQVWVEHFAVSLWRRGQRFLVFFKSGIQAIMAKNCNSLGIPLAHMVSVCNCFF